MTYYYNKGSSKQYNFRHDNSLRAAWKAEHCEGIQDITLDLLGTVSSPCFRDSPPQTYPYTSQYINTTSATSALQAIDPLWEEDGRIIEWSQFRLNPDNVGVHSVSTLVPQGFYLKLGTCLAFSSDTSVLTTSCRHHRP